MGVRILSDGENAVLYCSTSEWAFGPVLGQGENYDDPAERAERFLKWLDQFGGKFGKHPHGTGSNDPRSFTDAGLSSAYCEWQESNHHLGGKPCQHRNTAAESVTLDADSGYGDATGRCPDCGAPLKAEIRRGEDPAQYWEIDTDRDYAQIQGVAA